MHIELNKKTAPIVYTSGDPAGIGMDIIIQACQKDVLDDVIVLANTSWLKFRAEKLGIQVELLEADLKPEKTGQLRVEHFETEEEHSAFFTFN